MIQTLISKTSEQPLLYVCMMHVMFKVCKINTTYYIKQWT